MRKIVKIICFSFTLCIMAVFLSSCSLLLLRYNGYRGEHKDLYSVAVNNVFSAKGYLSNGEVSYDPKIHIIETDDYGRTLFFYSEFYDGVSNPEMGYGMAFVVMQSSKDGYAYYYRDKCYIPYFDVTGDWEKISAQLAPDYLDSLKKENDWNLELNQSKCAKVKIDDDKPKGKLRPRDYELDEFIYPYEVKNGYKGEDKNFCKFSTYCETDCYGRELHYVFGFNKNPSENDADEYIGYEYAIILNADGTCSEKGIVRIENPCDSAEAIRKLKLDNKWNISK